MAAEAEEAEAKDLRPLPAAAATAAAATAVPLARRGSSGLLMAPPGALWACFSCKNSDQGCGEPRGVDCGPQCQALAAVLCVWKAADREQRLAEERRHGQLGAAGSRQPSLGLPHSRACNSARVSNDRSDLQPHSHPQDHSAQNPSRSAAWARAGPAGNTV